MAYLPRHVRDNEGAPRAWNGEVAEVVEYVSTEGVTYSDEDVERWGQEAEAGFPGWKFGRPIAGRPISVGADARPFSFRLDADRRAKLIDAAKERQTTPSQVMRDLIDTL